MIVARKNAPIHGETPDIICLYKKTTINLTDKELNEIGRKYPSYCLKKRKQNEFPEFSEYWNELIEIRLAMENNQ
jgi:hypothetical protein